MNIRYNHFQARFEAEFSTDFQGDLAAVKGAGFRTDGPPAWVWWTAKIPALNKLRENKPLSGLTITDDAFAAYTRLADMEAKNEEARKQFAPVKEKQAKAKKERKKKEEKERNYTEVIIPHKPGELFDYIGKEDLSPMPPSENRYIPPPPPATKCIFCGQPTYFYELPDRCIFCEKNY